WHDDALCRAERQDGEARDRISSSPSLRRISAVPRRDRCRVTHETGRPFDHGQLRDAQNRIDPELVRETPALPSSYHPDVRIVAEPRGAMVRRTDDQTAAARCTPERGSIGGRHPRVHRRASCESEAVRVDQDCGPDSRKHRAVRSTDARLSGRATYCANHAVRTLAARGESYLALT